MRLLNTNTLELEEFYSSETPSYAILSHTWGPEEVLFGDMADLSGAREKHGYRKLSGACRLARKQSYDYIWIDTCCIDKSSSAELSEAINSMFQWYRGAAVCYAYLSDVPEPDPLEAERSFRSSRWFTRGWTLQEMLAPASVEFYNADWYRLGAKTDIALYSHITEICGIDELTLRGGNLEHVSIARKMYWASNRTTTRIEDAAYSLLGIFDVNMPLLYGEGTKAFRRLQEEILRKSDDPSIFAWFNSRYSEGTAVDVLATSPLDFREISGLIAREPFHRPGRRETRITNQGIMMELPIISVYRLGQSEYDPFSEVEAILDCQYGRIPGTFPVIRLRSHVSSSGVNNEKEMRQYYRIMTGEEMGKFEYFDNFAFIKTDKDVLGLDPTQLDRDEFKKAMDYKNLLWKFQSVILTRRIPEVSNSQLDIPWSLSPLHYQYAPDNTGFWFVSYGTLNPITQRIQDLQLDIVHPTEQWDKYAYQLRVLDIPKHYYGRGQFRCLDGIFTLLRFNSKRPLGLADGLLLVGRLSDSRRDLFVRPWCKYIKRGTELFKVCLRDPGRVNIQSEEELETELTFETSGGEVKVAVETKEISGVFYHVVGIRRILDSEDSFTGLNLIDPNMGRRLSR
ncbi:hypothetical protein VHEMI09212 [[Torrubiella] hemipterigena]|uniref:Uncharacterized protein n=1 Tax=[Torrubiella] hemipterigena TaxID=1531966 RepID=A0A0A1TPM9_9HYPO|nr:hypothetical protein VHEMI09212 [[Torrubiella] hemipterigena]